MRIKPKSSPSPRPSETTAPFRPQLQVADASAEPLVHLYHSDAGGALRTLLGAAHQHFIGTLPSWKTGFSNPYEGCGEQALAADSEIDADVLDFQTQAFRLRMVDRHGRSEWICDHLRQLRSGIVEAIEVKQHPDQMDTAYVRKIDKARELLGSIGWKVVVRYEKALVGSRARRTNRANLLADRSVHLGGSHWAQVERLRSTSRFVEFGDLRTALDTRLAGGTAAANAVIARGRGRIDLDRLICDRTVVELLPEARFTSMVRW